MPAGPGSSLAGNSIWTLLAHGVSKIASLVFVAVVARSLSRVDYGYFNFALAFVPLFLVLGIWSLDAVVIRDIARDRSRASTVFMSGLIARVGLGLAALVLAIVVTPWFVDGSTPMIAIAVVGAALLLDEVSDYVGAVFRGVERMALYGTVVMVNRIVSTIITVIVLAAGGGLIAAALAYLAGSVIALGFSAVLLRKVARVRWTDFRSEETRRLVKEGIPLGIADAFNMAILRMGTVLLLVLRGPVAVALYGVAYRLFESFLFVVWSLATAALPRIAREERSGAAATFDLMLALTLAIYVPIAVLTPFAAHWLVTTIFSARYAAAAGALGWLTAALVFYGIGHMARVAAIGLGRRNVIARAAGAMVALNLVLNLALIPRYGILGAALATAATEGVQAVVLLQVFYRATAAPGPSRIVAVPLLAGGVSLASLMTLDVLGPLALVAGGLVYLVALGISVRLVAPDQGRGALRALTMRPAGSGAKSTS
jgi:O-antigen/teichoic acid export membrane protein